MQGDITLEFTPQLPNQEGHAEPDPAAAAAAVVQLPKYSEKEVMQMCHVKDKLHVSDAAYHELHMLCGRMPPLNVIKQKRAEWNDAIPLHTIDDVCMHHQCNF